jgi:hypothetical protein
VRQGEVMIRNPEVGMEYWYCYINHNTCACTLEKRKILLIKDEYLFLYKNNSLGYALYQSNNEEVYRTKEQAQAYYKRWLVNAIKGEELYKARKIKEAERYCSSVVRKLEKQLEKLG